MKIGGKKNRGYGRGMRYAIHNALMDKYGTGNYSTRRSHESRAISFVDHLKEHKVRDLRYVTAETVADYAEQLKHSVAEGCLAQKTAINRLSTVNVILQALQGDRACQVSPSACFGRRSQIREEPPKGMDAERVWAAAVEAREQGQIDLALAIPICRFVGARIREAALLDLRTADKSARADQVVTIVRGSKGNRAKSIPRVIQVEEHFAIWLGSLVSVLARRVLVPNGCTFHNWYCSAYRRFRPIAENHGLHSGFHDLRAAYACERYRDITGHEAPVISGQRTAETALDWAAREVLANDLGHARIDVVSSYIGGRR